VVLMLWLKCMLKFVLKNRQKNSIVHKDNDDNKKQKKKKMVLGGAQLVELVPHEQRM